MNRIVAIILTIMLSEASATAGIRHYCDTILATSTNESLNSIKTYIPSTVIATFVEKDYP